jgi:hypothetical protein
LKFSCDYNSYVRQAKHLEDGVPARQEFNSTWEKLEGEYLRDQQNKEQTRESKNSRKQDVLERKEGFWK